MNCALQITQLRISEHADGHYAALDLDGHCPQAVQALTIDYSLLFDLDRQHRGLLTLQPDDALYTTVLGPHSGENQVGGKHGRGTVRDRGSKTEEIPGGAGRLKKNKKE